MLLRNRSSSQCTDKDREAQSCESHKPGREVGSYWLPQHLGHLNDKALTIKAEPRYYLPRGLNPTNTQGRDKGAKLLASGIHLSLGFNAY